MRFLRKINEITRNDKMRNLAVPEELLWIKSTEMRFN